MPFSFSFFDDGILQFIVSQGPPKKILDIGPGAGKYGQMFRSALPTAVIDAVEVYEPYIRHYGLKTIYNSITISDVTLLPDNFFDPYDLIVFSDILEHLTVEQAQMVLGRVPSSSAMLVAVPYNYVQGEWGGNKYEEHKQPDLTVDNFHERYHQFELKPIFGNSLYGVYYRRAVEKP